MLAWPFGGEATAEALDWAAAEFAGFSRR